MFSFQQCSKIILLVVFSIFALIPSISSAEYTKKELVALDKFRPLVIDSLTHDYQKIDSYLIRWIRSKDFNLIAAAEMLHKAQKWRKENKVDTILEETSIFEEGGFIESLDGVDREGNPVLTYNVGKMDIRRLILEGKYKSLIRSSIHLREKLTWAARQASNRTGTDISQAFLINDMNGYTRRSHLCIPCIAVSMEWLDISEKYYPGFVKLQVLVNVPRVYDFIAERYKLIQSPHTSRTTKVFGHNKAEWSAFLDKYIAPDQRSYQFGGTKKVK